MSLDVLGQWRTHLGDLGELGAALCAAIERDDVLGAIAAMAQLRRTRAAIARVEAPARLAGSADELAAMLEVGERTIRARGAGLAMQRWLARPLPTDAVLLETPRGVAVLADAVLPEVWDFEADVVVLVGAAFAPVVDVLRALGQARIVVVADAPVTADAIGATSVDEAVIAVRTMVPGPPTRLVVRAASQALGGLARELADRLRDVISDLRIHRNTVHAFSRTWVEQGIANLPAIARWPSVAAVGDGFAGVPMVIVAPGPSLAGNAHLLRELRGRAIITAFSHSLRPVLAAGVTPDLVVTVDPQDVRYHFAGCDLSRSCLVNAVTVHPALFTLPAQRFLTLSANSAIDDWIFDGIGEPAVIPGGGSVATTAYSLALAWRCDPIVFVGLDLSFPGGAYYVATSHDGEARAEVDDQGVMRVGGWSHGFRAMKAAGGPAAVGERVVELPGWHGGSVRSSFMFSMFHRWFVERTRAAPGVTVINSTEGGAWIDGMQHRPLADVIAGLDRELDVGAVLARAMATAGEQRQARLGGYLTGVVDGLGRARRLAAVARRLLARGDTGRRLARIEQALATTLAPLAIASLLAQREVERAHDVARRPGEATDFVAASQALLGTLVDVIDRLAPALGAVIARLGDGRNHGLAA